MTLRHLSSLLTSTLLALTALLPAGCDRLDMYDQPRVEPLEASRFYRDGMSARPRVDETVARGELREDDAFYRGVADGKPVVRIPPLAFTIAYEQRLASTRVLGVPDPTTPPSDAERRLALLERGRERYDIFCSACHGRIGDGDGMIVRRGFRKPPSFAIDRLRNAPSGHYFDVVTNGIGAMPSYASRIEPADRWAIVAYVRALQLRAEAKLEDVPEGPRKELEQASTGSVPAAAPEVPR